MNLTALSIEKRTVTYFAVLLLILAGISSFFKLGQLEDPEFSIKTAVITTTYPGASPEEVEQEVTDRVELAMQQIQELDFLESYSRAGVSVVKVNIKPEYWSDKLPQIWDMVRRKINDMQSSLPPGAGTPIINDDFGDVFGLVLAVTSDGYSYAEMEKYADDLKREISLIPGVGKVSLWGEQSKVIYVDVSQSQMDQLGISANSIQATLSQQNMVVDAGEVDVQSRRLRIAPTGAFLSPKDIENLVIQPTATDTLTANLSGKSVNRRTELIRIGDIAKVYRGYQDPAATLLRVDGKPSIGIAVSNVAGANVVDMGRAVDKRLAELSGDIPIGIELTKVHWQSDDVAAAVNGFFINLIEAVAIVLVVLALSMGWRMGVIIGSALILTILATLIIMAMFKIDLQRMSLGALVIALGMMVDNAIVVAEGMLVRMQQGMDRKKAAIEAASQPSWPLLGATVVAVMAFYPIYTSTENAGEYCQTLFTVVAISLLSSWIISITVTPLQCMDMLPTPKGEQGDAYGSNFYVKFRSLLSKAIHQRWLTIGSVVGLLVMSVVGFTQVKHLFFPDSAMAKFMIDYWAPEGSRIQNVSSDMQRIEERLMKDERVEVVASFVGAGPPRFYLPVEPEGQNPAYGQLIVNVHDFTTIRDMEREYNEWFAKEFPEAQATVRAFGVGPSETWKFEARFAGPADADPSVLRGVADKALAILSAHPQVASKETDWRQRVQTIVPVYSQERGRWSGITRDDVAGSTKRAYEGQIVGQYREKDDLYPIIVRNPETERENISGLDVLTVRSGASTENIPLSQVLEKVDTQWDEAVVARRDRKRTITVQANPVAGVTLPTLMKTLKKDIEAIQLPSGYSMEWGGETESSKDSQASLVPGVIPAIAIILMIIIALFNAVRPTLIIMLTIPFALIGIAAGLLGTNTPFGFMALLGAMSLAGMMIKNAIVLLDEINLNLEKGMKAYDAVILSTLSRLRPVMLAAATTVLGVIPLLQDVFWIGMAVTIMAGLTFGTVLTMVLIPVLYTTLFKIKSEASG